MTFVPAELAKTQAPPSMTTVLFDTADGFASRNRPALFVVAPRYRGCSRKRQRARAEFEQACAAAKGVGHHRGVAAGGNIKARNLSTSSSPGRG